MYVYYLGTERVLYVEQVYQLSIGETGGYRQSEMGDTLSTRLALEFPNVAITRDGTMTPNLTSPHSIS